MTTTLPRPTSPTTEADPAAGTDDSGTCGASLRRPVSLVGGAAMLAAPLLVVAGILTSPPQATRGQADYIASLARDPFQSALSASLLHYGWVAMALGLVVAMSLVRGRRGRALTLVGGLGGGFAVVQMSGLLLNDWFLVALGTHLPMPQAVSVADAMMVDGDAWSQVWVQSAKLAIALPVLLYAGLARAGVISWWLVPLAALPMVAPYVVMGLVGGAAGQVVGGNAFGLVAGGLVGLVCYLPTFLVGLRLVGRGRLARA
ncbi:hypothetical protein [Microlunatus flavus]|uniref:Uncharacterized protein n=1 Tax=Microlunatus flavus TaxID=1036181 RepID=A0A1H8Z2F9_9ACTN|nr:hypothetical protein [Microlunatus flavus]SEP57778.1 hypothetical protein SAMN05421756_10134 [Microlunatus flavus]